MTRTNNHVPLERTIKCDAGSLDFPSLRSYGGFISREDSTHERTRAVAGDFITSSRESGMQTGVEYLGSCIVVSDSSICQSQIIRTH